MTREQVHSSRARPGWAQPPSHPARQAQQRPGSGLQASRPTLWYRMVKDRWLFRYAFSFSCRQQVGGG